MTEPGRNAPCPCGSGKKRKKCCGSHVVELPDPVDRLRLAAFSLEDRLLRDMDRFATRRFGRGWFEGIAEYLEPLEPPTQEEASAYLIAWSYYLLPIEGRRLTEWFLEDRGTRLRDDERRFLLAQIESWPMLWEAQEIRPGQGVRLHDVLTGATAFLNDHSASKSLERYHVLLARVVQLDGIAIFGGSHPQPLPPLEAQAVIEAARRLHHVRTRPVPPESLRSFERAAELFRLWDDAAKELYDRPLIPALANTDGEPLLLTSDYFSVAPGQRAAVASSILTLEGAHATSDDPDPEEFLISKPGNAMIAAFPNTTLARLELREGELLIETNSLARADRARAAVEGACGDSIQYRIRKHTDPKTLIEKELLQPGRRPRREEATRGTGDLPPELAAQVIQDFKKRAYATWPDDPIPALGGKTPRQAAKTPAGRARLEALLKDYELGEDRQPEAQRYDVNELRRELGLETR